MELADPSTFFLNSNTVQPRYTSLVPANPSQHVLRTAVRVNDEQLPGADPTLKEPIKLSKFALDETPDMKHEQGLRVEPEPERNSEASNTKVTKDNFSESEAVQTMADFTKFGQIEKTLSEIVHKLGTLEMSINKITDLNPAVAGAAKQPDLEIKPSTEQVLGEQPSVAHAATPFKVVESTHFVPLRLKNLSPYKPKELKATPLPVGQLQTFSAAFLKSIMGSTEWTPGFFLGKELNSKPVKNGFYLANRLVDAFLPMRPGDHGARLTAFIRPCFEDDNVNYSDVPLFITASESSDEYIYFGDYSQSFWSDRLDYDRACDLISDDVRCHWADVILSSDRPEWLTEALMPHIVAEPDYEELISDVETAQSGNNDVISSPKGLLNRGTQGIAGELAQDLVERRKEWHADAKSKLNVTSKEDILAAFNKEDAGEEPGLRFWFEYLECVGYDRSFYYQLATAQRNWTA